jgi:hypothetical protein
MTMIGVMLDDGQTEVFLPQVDHMSTAQDAAHHLWEGVRALSNRYGGFARLLDGEENGWNVIWEGGPSQWSHGYVVCEGATTPEFTCYASDAFTVTFTDNQ